MTYDPELTCALEAVAVAGRTIMAEYARFKAIADAPADITTEVDRQSQELILQYVHRVFPEDALCAEEATPTLAQASRTGDRIWIVDPIDGTRGFARKNDEFSVMVAFVDRGTVAVGVVAEPALNRLTFATRGGGCWRRDGNTTDKVRCRVSDTKELAQATLIQSHSQKGKSPSPHVQALRPGRIIESYSAGVKLARVARGEADLYLNNYAFFHDWDICAGDILVTEGGGKVTGLGGQELIYGFPGAPQNFGLLASNGLLHAEGIQALRPVVS